MGLVSIKIPLKREQIKYMEQLILWLQYLTRLEIAGVYNMNNKLCERVRRRNNSTLC